MTKSHFENQIFTWLNNQEIRAQLETTNNLINIAFHHLIRWYPQISNDGRDTYKLNYEGKIKNWEISNRAIMAFNERLNQINEPYKGKTLDLALKDSTHPEHNVSVNSKKSQLLNLEVPNLQNVRNCLNEEYKVILLSKEESRVLNGNKRNEYLLDGQNIRGQGMNTRGSYEERLSAIGAIVANQQSKDDFIRSLLDRL